MFLKINEERKESLELQKAQAELDKARNQKTRMVLRKGVGWVYETDEDAIREAEENLSDLEYDSKVDKLEEEKEALENNLLEIAAQLNEIKQKMQELEKQAIQKAKIVGATLAKTYLSHVMKELQFFTSKISDFKAKSDRCREHNKDYIASIHDKNHPMYKTNVDKFKHGFTNGKPNWNIDEAKK
mgnify:CR=1 FL=1